MDIGRALIVTGLLALIAVALLAAWRIRTSWDPAVALGRAFAQLTLLSLLLSWILGSLPLTLAWLIVMLVVAIITSARRIGWSRDIIIAVTLSLTASAGGVLAIVFASGALAFQPHYLLALGGIVIGNMMTACALGGTRLMTAMTDHRDEVEGFLALGATPRQATRRLRTAAIRAALMPSLDQTRVTGLVTLPGAFTGAVFAGSPPLEAAAFQLLVLACAAAGGAASVIILSERLGAPATLPRPGGTAPGP